MSFRVTMSCPSVIQIRKQLRGWVARKIGKGLFRGATSYSSTVPAPRAGLIVLNLACRARHDDLFT